jgi:hypothetical protein
MLLAARGGNGARKTGKLPWITISRGFAKEKKTKDVEAIVPESFHFQSIATEQYRGC